MAFISGYETRYICPLCDVELDYKIKKPLSFVYDHPIDGFIMINDYPHPCENNGRTLNSEEVQKLDMPIIHSNHRTMSY